MLDSYNEIWEMAAKLKLSNKPLWYDLHGCPRWQDPKKESLTKYIKPIRCQYCNQLFMVSLVDAVYRSYNKRWAMGSGRLPKSWSYGDPPAHPNKADWEKEKWWEGGWDVICTGVTMSSISEWEFEEWNLEGKIPFYKEEHLAEKDERSK